MRRNKGEMIATSLLTVSPILIGFFLYQKLPEKIATHFDYMGNADSYSGKLFTVLWIPVIMLAVHVFLYFVAHKSQQLKHVNKKLIRIMVWLIPVVTFNNMVIIYAYALHLIPNIVTVVLCFLGIVFIVIGNYLPKCNPNYFVGIKTPWALASEDNWRATHRFSGVLWVIGGLMMLVIAVLQIAMISVAVCIGLLVIFPYIYSYRYYAKHNHLK